MGAGPRQTCQGVLSIESVHRTTRGSKNYRKVGKLAYHPDVRSESL